ncbi:replication initiation protein [Planomicrobium sp. CPCC 101110]|uniref:replication initiation protein n=1 Tax=Planomicrobium sp. CPCC 101110 TaxID=2599619 RepID=UPI0011B4B2D3|nr:replication initiation protein [Planomicrobium sp. CPCC 101110]TWT26565.1 replication initiation protein [Planomicrobium sp. CPCC 101110]
MQENYLVAQRNDLIEARHTNPLSVREQKIVLTMVSMIQPTDEDFKDYRISVKEFSEMLGLEGSAKYTELKEITKDLMSKSIEIPRADGGWLFANWISSAEYQKGEGIIDLSFSPKLKPYLLQLKNTFTTYRLSNILSLKSTYSIRLYELMKKWQHLGKWSCTIENFREKMGVESKKYPRYANLKARVLNPALEEVNEKTDLSISIKELKKGRSVVGIEFIIRHAPEKEIRLPSLENHSEPTKEFNELDELRVRLNELAEGYQFDSLFFSQLHQGASLIWHKDTEKELEMLIRYVNEEKTVKNPLGFIKSKITSAWEIYEAGGRITFADLQPAEARTTGRTEMLPEWFTTKDEPYESADASPELEELKAETLRQLAKKKEDFARKKNQKN